MKTTKVYKAPGYPVDPTKETRRILDALEYRPAYPSRIIQDFYDLIEYRQVEITCKKRVDGYSALLAQSRS